jgi:hypothetical protein
MKTTIELAREAGGDDWGLFKDFMPEIERLVALARADEREACAKLCEETEVVQTTYCMTLHDEGAKTLRNAAAAIRARGNT